MEAAALFNAPWSLDRPLRLRFGRVGEKAKLKNWNAISRCASIENRAASLGEMNHGNIISPRDLMVASLQNTINRPIVPSAALDQVAPDLHRLECWPKLTGRLSRMFFSPNASARASVCPARFAGQPRG
jgi:hypothetical protein